MLNNLGPWELLMLLLIGLFIFGPDKLPKAISDGVRMLRQVREMARNATSDLSRELGTEIELEDLHPKTFIRKHLLSEEDERALRKPLEDIYSNLKSDAKSLTSDMGQIRDNLDVRTPLKASPSTSSTTVASTPAASTSDSPTAAQISSSARQGAYDGDAT